MLILKVTFFKEQIYAKKICNCEFESYPLLRKYPPNRRNGVMRRGPRVRAIVTEGEAAEMAYPVHTKIKKIRDGFLRVCVTIKNGKILHLISISQYQSSQETKNIKLPKEEAAADASTEIMAALMNVYESCVRPGK